MLITKEHPVRLGETNTLDINITQDQYINWLNGQLIQVAMPNISPDEREFIINGLLPGEYDQMIKEPI